MHRPEVSWLLGRILEGLPDLGNEAGQVRLEHMRGWPQLLQQLGLGDRSRSVRDQKIQKVEGLRGQVPFRASAEQPPGGGVEREVVESVDHDGTSQAENVAQ